MPRRVCGAGGAMLATRGERRRAGNSLHGGDPIHVAIGHQREMRVTPSAAKA
jgi:hypothetical protein